MSQPVWYLAHPVAPDDRYTYEQNMAHTLKVIGILMDAGVRVVAPWHTLCLCLDESNPDNRRLGLEIDCYVASALKRIILTGHKVSHGMKQEVQAIAKLGEEGWIIDVVGVSDEFLALAVTDMIKDPDKYETNA